MNPHLIHIPRLASLTTGGFPGSDLEGSGGKTHGALDAQILGFGALEELGAHFFQRLHFPAREGDANFVDFLEDVKISFGDVEGAVKEAEVWL